MIFELETDYIELYKLLKAVTLCGSGGEAKHAIDSGLVNVNGVTETRRRCKIRPGDRVLFGDDEQPVEIRIVRAGEEPDANR